MRRTDLRRRQRGTQLVEMAIALPLLALLVFMIIEGSDLVRVHQVLNNAAREGARFSVNQDFMNQPAVIQQIVVNYAANNGVTLPAGNVTVNQNAVIPTPAGIGLPASLITITYQYPLNFLPRLPNFNLANTVTLAGQAEFANFY